MSLPEEKISKELKTLYDQGHGGHDSKTKWENSSIADDFIVPDKFPYKKIKYRGDKPISVVEGPSSYYVPYTSYNKNHSIYISDDDFSNPEYDKYFRVIIPKKNTISFWENRQKIPEYQQGAKGAKNEFDPSYKLYYRPIVNNPGQHVLMGGKALEGDTISTAAAREAFEESAIEPAPGSESMSVISKKNNGRHDFGARYDFFNKESFDETFKNIKKNIFQDKLLLDAMRNGEIERREDDPTVGDRHKFDPYSVSNELNDVYSMTPLQAYKKFNEEDGGRGDDNAYRKSTSWFKDILAKKFPYLTKKLERESFLPKKLQKSDTKQKFENSTVKALALKPQPRKKQSKSAKRRMAEEQQQTSPDDYPTFGIGEMHDMNQEEYSDYNDGGPVGYSDYPHPGYGMHGHYSGLYDYDDSHHYAQGGSAIPDAQHHFIQQLMQQRQQDEYDRMMMEQLKQENQRKFINNPAIMAYLSKILGR
jgi:hypothetical protein